ncbi:MAG: hypothetical protein ACM3SW_05850 [Actinomycetota bacterium]
MSYEYLKRCSLLFVLLGIGRISIAQISGADPGPHCLDEHIDAPAACSLIVFCTPPADPIDAFVIGANAFKTCSNQPVDNSAQADAAVGGVQASASAKAIGIFFNRLIKQQIRVGDCAGNTAVLQDFDDPQGCDPPLPPPPPDPCLNGTAVNLGGPTADGFTYDCSPIIVDTTGRGFQLTSAADGVLFDIAGTGNPVRIGWTAPDSRNAFLALPDSNGFVTNGTQLFGNFTPQPPSARPNGFLALAVYDKADHGGNDDGIIDQQDQVFSFLRLWIDENHDGICQTEELHNLPELGVLSIDLRYSLSHRVDQFGNVFRYRADINSGISGKPSVDRKAFDVFFTAK